MRVLRLSLENIGPFDKAELEFVSDPEQEKAPVTLITGENGAGKSIPYLRGGSTYLRGGSTYLRGGSTYLRGGSTYLRGGLTPPPRRYTPYFCMKKREKALLPTLSPKVLAPGALPDPADIPAVPEGVKPLDGIAKNALLKMAAEQRAEIDLGMEQLWAKRAELAQDLGRLSPDAERGRGLHERMLAAREANRKARALVAYTEDQEALANHAVLGHFNAASGDIEHVAQRDPQIAARYDQVLVVVAQRREAVAVGIARARARKKGGAKKG